MAYLYDLTDTWNAAGTVFNAIKMNVTNSASAAGSKIVSLQVGSTDRFTVDKDGNGYFSGTLQAVGAISFPNAYLSGNSGTIGMQDNTASILAYNGTGSGGITNTLRFITGASERMRIDGSGRVGVGVTPATNRLVMARGQYLAWQNTGTLAEASGITADTSDNMIFFNNGSERARIDSSGNVLIGTTTAVDNNFPLELNAGTSSVRGMGVNNNGGYGVYLTYDNTNRYSTNGAAIRNVANSPLYFETNNALRATLDASGNLGLGVTPSAWGASYKALQIPSGALAAFGTSVVSLYQNGYDSGTGAFKYVNSLQAAKYDINQGSHYWYTAPSGTAGNAISFTQAMTLDGSGNLLVGNTAQWSSERFGITGSSASQRFMYARTTANGQYLSLGTNGTLPYLEYGNGSGLAFSDGATERMRIDSSGNLGIGTSSPSYKLDVGTFSSSSGNIIRIQSGGDASLKLMEAADSYGFTIRNAQASGLNILRHSGDTTGVTAMFIGRDTGNVGIGTASPAAAYSGNGLDASGYLITRGAIASHQTSAAVVQLLGNEMWLRAYGATAGTGQIVFLTGGGGGSSDTERMRIDSSGNLGIGTSSPGFLLHGVQNGNAEFRVSATNVGSNSAGLTVENQGNRNWNLWANRSTDNFIIGANNRANDFLVINGSSGNVGIGTSSPSQKLDVNGSINAGVASGVTLYMADNSAIRNTATGGNTMYFDSGVGTGSTGGDFNFRATASYTSCLYINGNTGNVGIGTSSPGDKLTVNGFVSATAGAYSSTNGGNAVKFGAAGQMNFGAGGSDLILTTNAGNIRFGNWNTNTEYARIDSSGSLLVGTTNTGYSNTNSILWDAPGKYQIINHSGTSSGAGYILFAYNGGGIGSISQDGTTGVLYNTTSDARLKENIAPADDASALIDAIQVRKFDWKADGSHQRYGMVAQELLEVAPEAVSVPADEEQMMGVDYSKLVPMLIKEIQSLRARVAQLEGN